MKKICSIFLLCIVCLVANAQKVQWGDFFKMEDHNKTRCDYLGTIDDLDYYSFGYYVTGGNLGKFNHIGFFPCEIQQILWNAKIIFPFQEIR